jgi:hypothetical protein
MVQESLSLSVVYSDDAVNTRDQCRAMRQAARKERPTSLQANGGLFAIGRHSSGAFVLWS